MTTPGSLPDLLENDLQAVFCGINPGASAAAKGHHFLGRGNRFWRVLHLAGFTPELVNARDDKSLLAHGYGITAVVDRPTSRASEVGRAEFASATATFLGKIERYRPRHLAFLGKPAFSNLFDQRDVQWGRQPLSVGRSVVWVLPNPSGLNRGFSLDELVAAYSELRAAVRPSEAG